MLLVEIVDHDEIEIGTRRHFPGAEPAEREDRGLVAADAAMRRRKIRLRPFVHGAQQHIGKPGENLARLLGRHRARQNPRADQKHMLLAEQPDGIEHVLIAARLVERARKIRFEALLVR